MNNTDLRIKKTYKLLSEALMELMKKKPFEKISVTEICDKAMVHRTTFYSHFEDKYKLLDYAIKKYELPFEEDFPNDNSSEAFKNYYRKISRETIININENIELFKIVLKKNKENSAVEQAYNSLSRCLYKSIEKAKSNGAKIDIPSEFLANFYASGIIRVIMWWIEKDKPLTMEEMLENIYKIIL